MKALRVHNLNFSYPDGGRGLAGASLEAERGSRTALVGRNGSGKTTLLMHLLGLLDGEGFIEVGGLEMSPKTVNEIRRRAGFLFSQAEYQFIMPDLLGDTVLGLSGMPGGKEEKILLAKQWLARFGLEEYAARSPLDLSSGEMKRAALAGIMARGPELLLLDEPMGNLDRPGAEKLIDMLLELDTTILFSTHRCFLVERVATRVAVMDEGMVTEVLPVVEALKSRQVRDLLY